MYDHHDFISVYRETEPGPYDQLPFNPPSLGDFLPINFTVVALDRLKKDAV